MFFGVDHGSRAMRIAVLDRDFITFELDRGAAKDMGSTLEALLQGCGCDVKDEVHLAAVGYSMGDGFCEIKPIQELKDRGLKGRSGAGKFMGTGTRLFDELKNSGLPVICIPGLHRDCDFLDSRFRRLYSHMGSPDKACASYLAMVETGLNTFTLADVSYNTSSVAVRGGRLVGGIDAAMGAPGIIQGPIGLDGIRAVDAEKMEAKQAFSSGGIAKDREEYAAFMDMVMKRDADAFETLDALALAVAMEIAGLRAFLGDGDDGTEMHVLVLAGEVGAMSEPYDFPGSVKCHLGTGITCVVLDKFSAAKGAALLARAVHGGADDIMGIPISASVASLLE
jgi:putative methanogenesis marker protein 12